MANLEQFYEKADAVAYTLAEKVLTTLERELNAHVYAGLEPVWVTEKSISRLIFFQAQEDNIKLSADQLNQAELIVSTVMHSVFVGSDSIDPKSIPSYKVSDLLKVLQKVDPETRVFIDAPQENMNSVAPVYALDSAEGEYKAVSAFQAVICHVDEQKALVITTHY